MDIDETDVTSLRAKERTASRGVEKQGVPGGAEAEVGDKRDRPEEWDEEAHEEEVGEDEDDELAAQL